MTTYVVARSGKTKRPMCQHIVVDIQDGAVTTLCGHVIRGASVQYTDLPLEVLLCRSCTRKDA